MGKFDRIDFLSHFNSPEDLASQVLQVFFHWETPTFPVDPFQIMHEFGIRYQLRNFANLEGVYLVPDDDNDIAMVGININRPISRQRFTAAHEICHYIKDKNSITCPIYGIKSPVEKFADSFAAALLMPQKQFVNISDHYLVDGFIEFEDVLTIAEYFGVSFEACVYRLAYKFGRISGLLDGKELRNRIRKFKPDKKKIQRGIANQDLNQLRNMLNCYEFALANETQIVWHKFKINFVYNENRLEGVDINFDEISEIITDLRVNKQASGYCRSDFQAIMDVAGHSTLYDYIHETKEPISIFLILKLHALMGQYHPYPEAFGQFRNTNNLVIESKFETSDYHDISNEISQLNQLILPILSNKANISITDYVDECINIHHKLTLIHPFADGNGRVTRAFLNWMFRIRNLPPVYIKLENKNNYFDALSCADQTGNYDPLFRVFYYEIFRSLIELNTKFR